MEIPDISSFPPEYLAEYNGAALLDTCIAFLVLETIFIVLLYVSKYFAKDQKANLSMTLLMTAAYFTCCAKITLGILSVKIGGAGRHMVAVPNISRINMMKLQVALQIMCPLTTSITKLGILSLLHTILGRTSKNTRIAIKATSILVVVILVIQIIIPFANCKPFSHNWTPMGPGKCAIPSLALWRYFSIPNVVTTFIMIIIPLPALYKLKVGTPTRIGIGFVFGVCILGVVSAVMRFYSFLQVTDFHDITYETIPPLCWTVAESGIYLIAGVLPTLRPLMRKVCGEGKFERLLSRTFGRSSGKSAKNTFGSWGNKRASRMAESGGKPLPALPEKTGTEISKAEYSLLSVGSVGDSGRNSWERALIIARR